MAVTKREQQMLDLSEEGLSQDQIAAAMGIKEDSVKRTLCLLNPDPAGDRRHLRQMIAGSRELATRIQAMRGAAR